MEPPKMSLVDALGMDISNFAQIIVDIFSIAVFATVHMKQQKLRISYQVLRT